MDRATAARALADWLETSRSTRYVDYVAASASDPDLPNMYTLIKFWDGWKGARAAASDLG